jgi:hypothetical protein
LVGFGAVAAVLGVVAVIVPDSVKEQWWLLLICAAVGVAWALAGLLSAWPSQRYRDDRVTIRLVQGDLFAQRESALIGMSSTFDTDVSRGIINSNSVQASFLTNVYGGDVARLDADLNNQLTAASPVDTIIKPGKTDVYAIGTVVTLTSTAGVPYYCVAYTDMDSSNRAHGTIGGVLHALEGVWDAADSEGNKRSLCVPLIGQGAARIPHFPAEVAVRIMAFSFLLRSRRSHFSKELRIVLHPSDVDSIDLYEFQAFLKSLVPK